MTIPLSKEKIIKLIDDETLEIILDEDSFNIYYDDNPEITKNMILHKYSIYIDKCFENNNKDSISIFNNIFIPEVKSKWYLKFISNFKRIVVKYNNSILNYILSNVCLMYLNILTTINKKQKIEKNYIYITPLLRVVSNKYDLYFGELKLNDKYKKLGYEIISPTFFSLTEDFFPKEIILFNKNKNINHSQHFLDGEWLFNLKIYQQ